MDTSATCPFCEYAGPSKIFYRVYDTVVDVDIYFIEPLNPVTPGHLLAIPDKHVNKLGSMRAAAVLREAARRAELVYPKAFNLIVNYGADATQTIDHMHVHIVPRYPGDGLLLPWTPMAKVTA